MLILMQSWGGFHELLSQRKKLVRAKVADFSVIIIRSEGAFRITDLSLNLSEHCHCAPTIYSRSLDGVSSQSHPLKSRDQMHCKIVFCWQGPSVKVQPTPIELINIKPRKQIVKLTASNTFLHLLSIVLFGPSHITCTKSSLKSSPIMSPRKHFL